MSMALTFTNGVSKLAFSSYPSPKFLEKPQKQHLIVSCASGHEHDLSKDFYKVLSLSSKKAKPEEIRKAYRTLALKYHPDVFHDPLAKITSTKMFVLVQTAYKTLFDPVSRQEYDSMLEFQEPGHVFIGRSFSDGIGASRKWEGQIVELKKRSSFRAEQKEGSWGSRVRYSNQQSK